MSKRAHLHQLARQLRRVLAWQRAEGRTHYVPASKEEREKFEARKKAHQQAQLDALRSEPADEQKKATAAPTSSQKKRPQQSQPSAEKSSPPAGGPNPEKSKSEPVQFRRPGAGGGDEEEAKQKPETPKVTATTPIWKQHDSIREVTGGKRATSRKPAGSPDNAKSDKKPAEAPQTPAEKMAFLQNYLGDCQRCPLSEGRTNIVFGDGDPQADLMFIGEGPGRHEDQQGVPFVGKSGQLLTKMIEAMGLKREEVYITNVVKCRPPGNRNPAPLEIKECSPFLKKQIEVVEPKVIVTVGKFASNTLLQKDESLGRLRGRWHDHKGIAVMPTYHPAYLLRNEDKPKFKRRSWKDLQMVMQRLGLG